MQLLKTRLLSAVQALVKAQQQVQGGLPFWGRPLLSAAEQTSSRDQLNAAKQFLERLLPYDTPGKLKNLPVTIVEVQVQNGALTLLDEIAGLQQLTQKLSPLRDVLAGLTRVVVQFDALKAALTEGGSAARPEEIRARFERYMADLLRGKDAARVRIVVE